MNQTYQFQQGDVCIFSAVIPVDNDKLKPKTNKPNVLREGKSTGHAHRIVGSEFELLQLDSRLFARILSGDCAVIHEEHKRIDLPIGDYEVTPVHEYNHLRQMTGFVCD